MTVPRESMPEPRYPLAAREVADALAVKMTDPPGTPEAWLHHGRAYQAGYRAAMGDARAVVALLATGQRVALDATYD